eukprot:UN24419
MDSFSNWLFFCYLLIKSKKHKRYHFQTCQLSLFLNEETPKIGEKGAFVFKINAFGSGEHLHTAWSGIIRTRFYYQ